MTTTPHIYLSAGDVLARFRDGSLSPTAYADELLAHINATEGTINCTTGERLPMHEALAEAELRYANGTARPLEGLPVIVKEEQPIAGHPETNGSPIFRDNVASVTHPIIERIAAAGGIPMVRSTTPEFCIAAYTRGKLWGITRNPWNPKFAVGGSSGGTGAALAAGYGPLGTGSDTAAQPASPQPSTAWSGTNHRTAATRRWRPPTSIATAPTAPWPAPSPTSRCCRMSSLDNTRTIR